MKKEKMDEKDELILSLKRQLGGMSTSNANYRKNVQQLKDELKKLTDEYALLRGDYKEVSSEAYEYREKFKEASVDLNKYKRAYECFMSAPWWVRLFCKNDFIID